jgi:aminoglycoside phosphotransferase (APT) family kinase protein
MHNVEEMPARLAAFLAAHEPNAADIEVRSYQTMTGGYSRMLAKAEVSYTVHGATREETFVLRGDPPAGRSLIDTDRALEWDVLRTVGAHGVRVSSPRYFDPTGEHLGTRALVLQFEAADSLLPYLAASTDHRDVVPALAEAAASFHRIPLDQLPTSLTRPASPDAYLTDRIGEWKRTAEHHVEDLPILRFVGAWLAANRPAPVPLTLIHGDFQSANLMRDPDGRLVILDWELAQIGDPREDLGYFKAVAQAAPPDLIELDADAFCSRYRELTGLDETQLNPAVIAYFLVLGVVGTVRRLLEGGADYHRGTNTLLASLFNLNAVQFGQSMWLPVTRQLEMAFAAANGA